MSNAFVAVALLAGAVEEPASETPVSWTMNATLEGYYEYNLNSPYDRVNPLRAYDTRANSFSIQQLGLVFETPPEVEQRRRFGLRVDLQFGQATETVQGSPANEPRPDVYRNLWQVYGSYVFPVSKGLRADFGKFGSMLGYETNYAKDNDALMLVMGIGVFALLLGFISLCEKA